MGLIDEISTERIHIEEKIRGTFLSICLLESLIYHGLVVLIIFETNDECPNDSRRIMPLVVSVPFWFLAGKVCL